jgi:Tol biopolymer transport system component
MRIFRDWPRLQARKVRGVRAVSLMSLALLAIVLAVGAGETPTRRIAEPQSAEHGNRILFIRNFTLWAIDVDDGVVKQLTPEPVKPPIYLNCPSWSPEGAKIVFASDRSPDGQDSLKLTNIWVMQADGSGAIAVTHKPIPNHNWGCAVWSPDGRKLATLTSWYEGQKLVVGIWVMNADGSGGMPIMKASRGIALDELIWSPDGKKLAFASNRALDGSDRFIAKAEKVIPRNIWVINADGSAATPLTRFVQSTGFPEHLAWSPDSRKLAYDSNGALDGSDTTIRAWNIWIANADGSGAIPLTSNENGRFEAPAWSPDGSRLAFSSGKIWVINADGSGARPLTTLPCGPSGSPAWSPDGKMIAYSSDCALDGSNVPAPRKCQPSACSNLWVMQADGSGNRPLTRYELSSPRNFHWRP